jgi:hypothetical protein
MNVCQRQSGKLRRAINYGARNRRGKPISTVTAESSVNQVLNQRMCKRQQMR